MRCPGGHLANEDRRRVRVRGRSWRAVRRARAPPRGRSAGVRRPRLPSTTSYDLTLAVVVLALTLLGIAMVFSASGMKALDTVDDPQYYLTWQALWAVLGLAGMLAAMRIDYHRYRALSVPLLLVVVALLAMVLIPSVGVRAGGAARWLRFGPAGIQPAELAKLALILYLGTWLAARRE